MLIASFNSQRTLAARQHGVVLLIALIILVALTIGGISLLRSVDTTNLISGNLAFQQSATRSGESGTEDAIRSVIEASTPNTLWTTDVTKGYAASILEIGNNAGNPVSAAGWDAYWTTWLAAHPISLPVTARTCVAGVCTLPTEPTGNTASYMVQRLCRYDGDAGDPSKGCAIYSQIASTAGQDLGSGTSMIARPTQYLYRVTTRVSGPRNTVSYIQTIVAK